jgi:hypothetical protein
LAAPQEGGCSCGAVRYRLHAEPLIVHCCHCSNCQRQTGSAFVVNLLLEADHVELRSGTLDEVGVPRDDGSLQVISRCAACRIAIYSLYTDADVRFVRAGTLDEPATFEPDVHIYTRSKLPWVELPETARAFEGFYDPREVWPAESRQRYRALRAARGE